MTNTHLKVYDNYEISPCQRFEQPASPGKFYFEVCAPHEADVWTLYGHLGGEGVEAIGDFATCGHAEETFQRITGMPFAGAREVAARLRAMHAGPILLEALHYLLEQTVEMDLKYGIGLSEGEEDARAKALAAIARATGRPSDRRAA